MKKQNNINALNNSYKVWLSDYQDEWSKIFIKTKNELKRVLKEFSCKIDHVGSTSLKKIKAKPIIDILIGSKNYEDTIKIAKKLSECGWILEPKPCKYQLIFLQSINTDLDKIHIYICPIATPRWNSRIYFTKYLKEHPLDLLNYENLKINLAKQFPNDRNSYSKGKRMFCDIINEKAKKLYNYVEDTNEIEKLKNIYYDFIKMEGEQWK